MADAFIYDHVRTPRGRGKSDGALHEVTALALATVPLKALKERNNLAEDVVDDVVLGVRRSGRRGRRRHRALGGAERGPRPEPCPACRSAASAPPASMP